MTAPDEYLHERIRRLDERILPGPLADIEQFVQVMGEVTETQLTASGTSEPANPPIVDVGSADALVDTSDRLRRLAAVDQCTVP